ncbi:prolyl oligopeptidase family serine peptidase [Hymenobacter sp. H14-R3]|uniref:alpha/beta hydrolase family protein n=1 Tax=Hymenobacter sp. H14-R3 TaxID=3046308 RepID=UPI0024BADBE1|nr:prolyl oligopeptidase family serine peptidase [Hymenobacter sp. H14-R3]MDJ0367053.1 prolyl oligopeptidase family serine peptidase [Hymenobacter sp. H14-R3]
MKLLPITLILLLTATGCEPQPAKTETRLSLAEARRGFKTQLTAQATDEEPAEEPQANDFQLVKYESPVGKLAAYLTPDPHDGKKHPAIIWIAGGDCASIGDVWTPAPADNDQTASAYRQAGIVMLFPSLRGGNDNPGRKEGFLGEVDDVLAATNFLQAQHYVDAKRIYLGGHSTGGTLALLVAESTNRYRATFAFGPVESAADYGTDSGFLPFDPTNQREVELRTPGLWLHSIQTPVWVFEGTEQGNIESLRAMAKTSTNPQVRFIPVRGASHFSILSPTNQLIAQKILADNGPLSNLDLSEKTVNQNFNQ